MALGTRLSETTKVDNKLDSGLQSYRHYIFDIPAGKQMPPVWKVINLVNLAGEARHGLRQFHISSVRVIMGKWTLRKTNCIFTYFS